MNYRIIFLYILLCSQSFGQNKIIFEKKNNPSRHYEIETPAYCDILFMNGKINGYVSEVKDSVLVVRIFNPGKMDKMKDKMDDTKNIMKNKTLSKRERENKLVKYMYRDSLVLPVSAVKRMKFYSAQKRYKYVLASVASFAIAALMTELYVNWFPTPAHHDATDAYVLAAGFSAIFFTDYNLFVKRINPRKWQIRK